MAILLSHGATSFYFFSAAAYYGTTSVIVSTIPPTTETVDQALRYGSVQDCCVVPFTLADISKHPAYLRISKGLNFVVNRGGPLPKHACDTIQKAIGTPILSLLGTTETTLLPLEASFQQKLNYHLFSPCLGGESHHWRAELYELVTVRR